MQKIAGVFLFIFFLSANGFSQCSNVNLAENLPMSSAFCSSSGNTTDAWRAFDGGDFGEQTRWSPADTGQYHYVGIDLGQAYNICSIYIRTGSFDFADDFKIQGSNDTSGAWTDLIHITNNTQAEVTINSFPTTGTYRYVRALLLDRYYDWSSYSIYSFEIYARVPNVPPSINLTSPVAGASYQQGTKIEMTATAMDVDGTVSKVEFYQGITKIGEDSTAPYSFSWTPTQTGSFAIEARAIDNGGAYTWTDSAHITVTPAWAWSLNGNTGVSPANQFLGNQDSAALVIKTNNLERLRITPAGSTHIGNALADSTVENGTSLQIHGQVSIDSLKSGANTDSVVVVNNKILKKIPQSSLGVGALNFSNGFSNNAGVVKLGGPLTNSTTISNADSSFSFQFQDGSYHKIGINRGYTGRIEQYGKGRYQYYGEKSVSPTDWWNVSGTYDTLNKTYGMIGTEATGDVKMLVGSFSGLSYNPFPQTANNNQYRLVLSNAFGLYMDNYSKSNIWGVDFQGQMYFWKSPPTGASIDSVLVWDASSRIVKKIAQASLGSGTSNAWTSSGNNISNTNSGVVTIGTAVNPFTSDPNMKLAVDGNIYAKKLKVTQLSWPDYVFDKSYKLKPLKYVEQFIHQYKHLPEVPAASQIENNGVDVGEHEAIMLKKLEELTLYIIDENKKQEQQQKIIADQTRRLDTLQKQVKQLKRKSTGK